MGASRLAGRVIAVSQNALPFLPLWEEFYFPGEIRLWTAFGQLWTSLDLKSSKTHNGFDFGQFRSV